MKALILIMSLISASFVIADVGVTSLKGDTENFVEVKSEKLRPWPRVTAWGNSVEVAITNYDDQTYRCSGSVWMRLESGRSRSEFVSVIVYPRSNAYRRIYNYDMRDRIRSASHSISCF